MEGKAYLYFLQDDKYNVYSVQNGQVLLGPGGPPLAYSPDGWQDISIQNQRNQKYFAIDRSFTVPLNFVNDGAQILKNVYYNKGSEAKLFLVIAKQELFYDGSQYGFFYSLFYRGEVDLSTFKHQQYKVTVNIMEGGIPKWIKANENVKSDYPLSEDNTIKVKLQGPALHQKTNFFTPAGGALGTHLIGAAILTTEGQAGNVAVFEQIATDAEPTDFDADPRYMVATIDTVDITIAGSLKYTPSAPGFSLSVYLQSNMSRQITLFTVPNVTAGDHESVFNVTFTAQPGEKFFLIGNYSSGIVLKLNYEESAFSISFTSRFRVTYCRAFRPKRLLELLTDQLTNNEFKVDSTQLDNNSFFVVTSGDGLRGFADAKVKTSFSDFYTSFNSILCSGVGQQNGRLKFENKSFWVDYSSPTPLGESKNLQVGPSTDYLYNTMKIGYPDQSYNDKFINSANGRSEFNNSLLFTTPNTRINKELTLMSVYRADGYGIEFTRINFDNKTSADSTSDNDVFILHIKATPIVDPVEGVVYELDRSLNSTATGIDEPATVFNLALTPKRNLLRNGAFIRSCFYRQDSGMLTFQTTEKNSLLVCDGVTETGDTMIGDLDSPLFFPVQLEFDTEVPVDILSILETSPMQSMSHTYQGVALVGIPVKVGIAPVDNKPQTYQLLSSPNNQLNQLEAIFE